MIRLNWRAATAAACIALCAASGAARAQETPLVTGEHWMKSTEEVKKAYLVGLANVIQIEVAYHGESTFRCAELHSARCERPQGRSHARQRARWPEPLVREQPRPDAATGDQTIWFEMVVPGLK